MKTRDFAAKFIRFDKTSPVTGNFRLELYPFLGKPLDAADDIRIKRLVILKASSCLGTVLGQIINAKRIACDVGDQIMVCQTDDDASKWTKTRGKEWLESINDVERLVKNDKYAKTNDLWLFRHKFLKISGPGITAAQSDQVRYVQTDESHLETYSPGRLVEWEKRMGARWDRQSTHITTAADEGKEIDGFYYVTDQNEWHHRCPKCNKLFWPLWQEASKAHYNGEEVFIWREHQSETATLDSIQEKCPHCDHIGQDTSRDRFAWQRDADYVAMNPGAPIETSGYRWSAFGAAHWMPLREFLAEFLAARTAVLEFSNLKPHEDFVKKRECRSYRPVLPDYGQEHGSLNYSLADSWGILDTTRILTADYQAGKKAEGSHLWALCTEWDTQGNSRRVAFRKFDTWAQLRQFQLDCGVDSRNVYIDCGYDDRTVFSQCSLYHWYAVQGSSLQQYHTIKVPGETVLGRLQQVPMPYSQAERANGNVGARQPAKLRSQLRGGLPPGWCLKIVMGNDRLYGYLHALQAGATGRYFGIARDMPDTYTEGFPAFIPVVQRNKQTNVESVIWRKVKPIDHPWDCEVMALMGAMRASCYPLKETQPEQKPELITS